MLYMCHYAQKWCFLDELASLRFVSLVMSLSSVGSTSLGCPMVITTRHSMLLKPTYSIIYSKFCVVLVLSLLNRATSRWTAKRPHGPARLHFFNQAWNLLMSYYVLTSEPQKSGVTCCWWSRLPHHQQGSGFHLKVPSPPALLPCHV